MSHGIRVHEDGRATFCAVDQGAWHGLVKPVKGPVTMRRAVKLAHMEGLDYQLAPLYVIVGDEDKGEEPDFVDTSRYGMVARNPFDRTVWESIGGAVTDQYIPHTIEDITAFGEAVVGAGATVSAVGLIEDGRKMFASFKVRDYNWFGDEVHTHLNVMTDFTGGGATLVKPGAIRVVCKNTMQIAMQEQVALKYRARHTGAELVDRVEEARAALGIAERAMDQFEVQVQRMLDAEVTATQFEKIVAGFVPIQRDASDKQKLNVEAKRDDIVRIWRSPTVQVIQGTAWGAFNALTEYVDWTGGSYKTDQARFAAAITPGSNMDKERARALSVVREVVLQ